MKHNEGDTLHPIYIYGNLCQIIFGWGLFGSPHEIEIFFFKQSKVHFSDMCSISESLKLKINHLILSFIRSGCEASKECKVHGNFSA